MWHRAGTITVTNGKNTVTGAGGTAWVQNIRVGDALQGPDGRYYEVTNVASDTALSIEPAYMGSTASGQWYQILPILGQQKRLADKAAELVGAVGQLPSDVRENADAIGRNEDRIANAEQAMLTKIGNLSGLQDLKQSQLNLGVIQSLAGEVFNTDNCTVIENANGISFRHPQGLQICIATPEQITSMSAYGNIYRGTEKSFNWPQPFIRRPGGAATPSYVSLSGEATTAGYIGIACVFGATNITAYSVNMMGAQASAGGWPLVIGVGKWRN